MHALFMSIKAYEWPRRLLFEGLATTKVFPTRGIAAGSAQATFELECLLEPEIRAISEQSPEATTCSHVDDLCMTIWGDRDSGM